MSDENPRYKIFRYGALVNKALDAALNSAAEQGYRLKQLLPDYEVLCEQAAPSGELVHGELLAVQPPSIDQDALQEAIEGAFVHAQPLIESDVDPLKAQIITAILAAHGAGRLLKA